MLSAMDLSVRVECYAGYRGDEEPRRFSIGRRVLEVLDVVDRWISPESRYFKVRAADGDVYILRHDAASGRWEMTMYQNCKKLPPLSCT